MRSSNSDNIPGGQIKENPTHWPGHFSVSAPCCQDILGHRVAAPQISFLFAGQSLHLVKDHGQLVVSPPKRNALPAERTIQAGDGNESREEKLKQPSDPLLRGPSDNNPLPIRSVGDFLALQFGKKGGERFHEDDGSTGSEEGQT